MNLTINEQLMHDTKDANLCIFISNLAGWIRTNASKMHVCLEKRNFREGRYWSYNSMDGLVKYFGFWSTKNLRTIIKNCIDKGLVITNNFNKKKYDKTCWYALTDKALEYYPLLKEKILETVYIPLDTDLPQTANGIAVNGKAIPKNINSYSNINITTNSDSKSKSTKLMREMIDVYREIFPDNPQPHQKLISTTLQKTLQTLIKRWPEADPLGKPLDILAFRRYLKHLKISCPKFALNEYETSNGRRKKNDLETFSRWNTLVKCLEGSYS